jgi:glycine hydroxymethyltransferase
MLRVAEWIDRVAKNPADEAALGRIAGEVNELCAKYPAQGVRV